jgi:hypothetical protein
VLAAADQRAAEIGMEYALIDLPPSLERYWSLLPFGQIQRYRSVAQAVINIRADQILDDLA